MIGVVVWCSLTSVSAQDVEITSTDPPDGAFGVDATKRVTFRLNKPLPAFGSQFAEKFIWSPRSGTRLTMFGHDFDDEGELTIIFFTLEHEPETDVSFIAFGIRADDGSRMHRPFVLNYTTASTQGANTVRGTVEFGERVFAPSSDRRQYLESEIRRALLKTSVAVLGKRGGSEAAPGTKVAHSTRTTSASPSPELRRTVVLLLERYSLNEERWVIRKAAVPDVSGIFTLEDVRDGMYWPVAINYATDDGEVIGSYGFYDADGDLVPDPIDVTGGSVSDLSLELYSASPFTALTNLPLARDLAAPYAADQQLINMKALQGPSFWEAYPDGSADMWRYTFHSPSENRTTYVAIDPINVYSDADEGTTYSGEPMPVSLLDTDEVMEIADRSGGDTFRAQYPDQTVSIAMEGGDLPLGIRPQPSEVFWMVVYGAPETAPSPADTLFIDVESGEVLQGIAVAAEPHVNVSSVFTLDQNYPNPFNPSTTIPLEIGRGGQVTLLVYNALGQEVARPVERYLPAGTHAVEWNPADLPSGLYFYEMSFEGRVETRAMMLTK